MKPATVAALLTLIVTVVATGCTASENAYPASPYRTKPVSFVPSPGPLQISATGDICEVALRDRADATALVHVDEDPESVVVVRFAPTESARCDVVFQRFGADRARQLAMLVDHVRPFPSGTFNCPSGSRRAVNLYFTYPREVEAEFVHVQYVGCTVVTAPGHVAGVDPSLLDALEQRGSG